MEAEIQPMRYFVLHAKCPLLSTNFNKKNIVWSAWVEIARYVSGRSLQWKPRDR
jgi:hypothetical protein